MRNFDELRSVKDFDKQLRSVKDFDSHLRLAKDFAQKLWIPKQGKKRKPTAEELAEIARQEEEEQKRKREEKEEEELEDFLLMLAYILCLIYALGWKDAEQALEEEIDVEWNHDLETVDEVIDGKTFEDRIRDAETYEEVERIIDTEGHRDYNAGVYNAAKATGRDDLLKTWRTMLDDKVRDSHQYLEGVTVGLDDYFYTAGGARALYPGQFGEPDEDINCRCFIEITAV
ncbi:MAG: hypothetical protein J6Y60_03600 [Treponema sp.]|nr:hypothetical protein [Treponema sp.]